MGLPTSACHFAPLDRSLWYMEITTTLSWSSAAVSEFINTDHKQFDLCATKCTSLDSYSGTVGLNYYSQHVQMFQIPRGHKPCSQLQALRTYAAYSTDLEMT